MSTTLPVRLRGPRRSSPPCSCRRWARRPPRMPLVSTVHNARLKATILVNRSGHTLYNLSVERKGHFICTNSTCLSFWHPLVVPKGTKPTGRGRARHDPAPRRPHPGHATGARRCTRSSRTRSPDRRNGEGFKDVGVWHATTVGAAAATRRQPKPSPGYSY